MNMRSQEPFHWIFPTSFSRLLRHCLSLSLSLFIFSHSQQLVLSLSLCSSLSQSLSLSVSASLCGEGKSHWGWQWHWLGVVLPKRWRAKSSYPCQNLPLALLSYPAPAPVPCPCPRPCNHSSQTVDAMPKNKKVNFVLGWLCFGPDKCHCLSLFLFSPYLPLSLYLQKSESAHSVHVLYK